MSFVYIQILEALLRLSREEAGTRRIRKLQETAEVMISRTLKGHIADEDLNALKVLIDKTHYHFLLFRLASRSHNKIID
jgi:hypothetical protein